MESEEEEVDLSNGSAEEYETNPSIVHSVFFANLMNYTHIKKEKNQVTETRLVMDRKILADRYSDNQ